MNIFRSALSACVISGLHHIRYLIKLVRQQILYEERSKNSNKTPQTITSISTVTPVGTLSAAVGTLSSTIDHITNI